MENIIIYQVVVVGQMLPFGKWFLDKKKKNNEEEKKKIFSCRNQISNSHYLTWQASTYHTVLLTYIHQLTGRGKVIIYIRTAGSNVSFSLDYLIKSLLIKLNTCRTDIGASLQL